MATPSSVLFVLGVLITARAAAQTEVQQAEAAVFEAALAGLGQAPPRLDDVHKLVRHPCACRPEWAQPLVEVLSLHRAYASASGLLLLAEHPIPSVRATSLQALTEVGLRVSAADAQPARAALRDEDAAVRVAAAAALGVVGDGSDVPALLDLLAQEDPRLRLAAFRALQSLTGLELPCQQREWTYWWTHSQAQLAERIDVSIAAIEDGGNGADVLDARLLLSRSAWFDARKIEQAARSWMQSSDARLRREGYGLAASARLGSLAENVAFALRCELDDENLSSVVASAKALGVPTDGIEAKAARGEPPLQASPAPAGETSIQAEPAPAAAEAAHDALIARLDAADDATRLVALKELGILARPEDGERVAQLLQDSESDAIRKQACLFLGRVMYRPAVRELIDVLRDTEDPGFRANAHWSLRRITGQKLPQDVRSWELWWQTPGNGFAPPGPR